MGLFNRKKAEGEAPTPIGAVVGSGSTYRVASYTDATHLTQLRQLWQQKAFDLYDNEGHLFYATNYVGSALSRVQLVAAVKPKQDRTLTYPTMIPDGPLRDAVANIASPKGGQSGLLRQLGRNVFLVGECWLVASTEEYPDGTTAQKWDAVSIDELTVQGTSEVFLRRSLPGGQPRPLPAGSATIRIWKEHPRYSELADAGTRSCVELLEKIVVLNRAEKAIARSRLAGSGILALPQELVPPAWQNQDKNPNPMESNPLWQALAESMTAPLKDEGHPSSVVPLLLVGPGDVIGKMKYEGLERKFDTAAAQSSITNAIEQVANTLELPKEILLGSGEVNHWTAWAIREDVFQAHIQPLIELICQALTNTYLKQALAKLSPAELKSVLSDAGAESADDIVVWYDASELIIRPDKGDKAIAMHDRFAISDEALRRESGFSVEDAPSEEEYAKRVGIKMADPKMALTGKPTEPPAAPEATPAAGGGKSGPLGVSPGRGKSPQGPRSSPPLQASQRRKAPGTAQQDKRAPVSVAASAVLESPAATLGRFDVQALASLRKMADDHLSRALTASADPGDFIPDDVLSDFDQWAFATWGGGIEMLGDFIGRNIPMSVYDATVKAAVMESRSLYQQMIRALLGDRFADAPVAGEFNVGGRVQYGDVRPLLVRLGGGSVDPTVTLSGGVATGQTMQDWMSENGVPTTAQRIWLYGYDDEPRRVFNGHLQMDGLVFESWEDDGLEIAPQDYWLRRSHYAPGDHRGCACVVAPYIPNFDQEFRVL